MSKFFLRLLNFLVGHPTSYLVFLNGRLQNPKIDNDYGDYHWNNNSPGGLPVFHHEIHEGDIVQIVALTGFQQRIYAKPTEPNTTLDAARVISE